MGAPLPARAFVSLASALVLLAGVSTAQTPKASYDSEGRLFLDAAKAGHADVVVGMLAKNPKFIFFRDPAPSASGRTALLWAATNRSLPVVAALIQFHPKPDMLDMRTNNTVFGIACAAFSHDGDGQDTALHLAAADGDASLEIVKALVKAGAGTPPDLYSSNGATPLDMAVCVGDQKSHEGVVRFLLDGLDPSSLDANRSFNTSTELHTEPGENKGQAPLHFAVISGHEEFVKMLLQKGAKPETADNKCRTALSYAAEEGDLAIVTDLLNYGAGVDDVACAGNGGVKPPVYKTPIRLAIDRRHWDVVKALLDRGADPGSDGLPKEFYQVFPAAVGAKNSPGGLVAQETKDWEARELAAVEAPVVAGAPQKGPAPSGSRTSAAPAQSPALDSGRMPALDIGLPADEANLEGVFLNPASKSDAKSGVIRLLNLKHDPKLLGFFSDRLADANETQQNRNEAAFAAGSILATSMPKCAESQGSGFNIESVTSAIGSPSVE